MGKNNGGGGSEAAKRQQEIAEQLFGESTGIRQGLVNEFETILGLDRTLFEGGTINGTGGSDFLADIDNSQEEIERINNSGSQFTKVKSTKDINIGLIPAKQITYSSDIGLDFQKTINKERVRSNNDKRNCPMTH